jgi:hypothetical protein
VLESLGHIYNSKLNLFDPETKMQSFVYQIFVLICTFFVTIQFNLCLVFLNNLLFLSKQMDRSWIFGKQFTPAYLKGVEEFMEFVRARSAQDIEIRCPCCNCLNQRVRPQHDVENHIHIFGMSATYTRWIHHGEPADSAEVENTEQ